MRVNQLILLVLTIICGTPLAHAVNQKRPWTVLVYMAADNSLNEDADPNIDQIVKASGSANVNYLVYLNIKRNGEAKKTQKLVIANGRINQDGATTVEDSGIEATLVKALTWAVTQFPSDHLLVDLWDHGSGSLNRDVQKHRGVCYDDTTNHYLTDLDYKRAFDLIVNQYRGGKKIDIIAFDACLMADLEVAYTLLPYADYQVSSQQTVPGPGFDYTAAFSIFNSQPSVDPLTLAQWLVNAYGKTYASSGQSYTLSAVNLSKLPALVTSVNTVAQLLQQAIAADSGTNVSNAILKASASPLTPHFDEPTYVDLYTLLGNLYMHAPAMKMTKTDMYQLQDALRIGVKAVNPAIVSVVHSKDFAKARGLSIYLADPSVGVEPSYEQLYWTSINPSWANFLSEFVSNVNP